MSDTPTTPTTSANATSQAFAFLNQLGFSYSDGIFAFAKALQEELSNSTNLIATQTALTSDLIAPESEKSSNYWLATLEYWTNIVTTHQDAIPSQLQEWQAEMSTVNAASSAASTGYNAATTAMANLNQAMTTTTQNSEQQSSGLVSSLLTAMIQNWA